MRELIRKFSRLRVVAVVALAILIIILILSLSVLLVPRRPTGIGPTWNNVAVGVSTEVDVIAVLGSPSRIEESDDNTTTYYYQYGTAEWVTNRIVFRDGVIDYIEESLSDLNCIHCPPRTYLADFIDRYGSPDRVTWSELDSFRRIVIFLDKGVMIEVMARPDPHEAEAARAFYYSPCSFQCVQGKFDQIVMLRRRPDPDSDVIINRPRNPWWIRMVFNLW